MRGQVCRLQLLLALASAVILGSHLLLPQVRNSPNLEGQVSVFISPRNRVAQLHFQALGSLFVASYDSQGYGGGIRTHLHAGILKTELLIYKNSVRSSHEIQYVSVTKRSRLMLFGEKKPEAYCTNYTKHTNTLWAKCKSFSMLK
jgi:hypothetical protein